MLCPYRNCQLYKECFLVYLHCLYHHYRLHSLPLNGYLTANHPPFSRRSPSHDLLLYHHPSTLSLSCVREEPVGGQGSEHQPQRRKGTGDEPPHMSSASQRHRRPYWESGSLLQVQAVPGSRSPLAESWWCNPSSLSQPKMPHTTGVYLLLLPTCMRAVAIWHLLDGT
jgi:hypothetical protein